MASERIRTLLLVKNTGIRLSGKRLASVLILKTTGDHPNVTAAVKRIGNPASEAQMTGVILPGKPSLAVVLSHSLRDVVKVFFYESPVFVHN